MSGLSLLTQNLDSSMSCTPTKGDLDNVLSIITPEMKKSLFSTPDDDGDSEMSMGFKKLPEDLNLPRFSALCSGNPSDSLTPDICFQIHRPKRKTGSRNALFPLKRPLEEETTPAPKKQRCDTVNFKRSFSFGDQPATIHSPRTMANGNCKMAYSPMQEAETKEDRLCQRTHSPIPEVETMEDRLCSPMQDVEIAVSRLSESRDLIADGSSTFCLPTVRGQHPDLKSIAPSTMSEILSGRFADVIDIFKVIDCRYPYEFEGGHVKGAENRYTHESILELLTSQATPTIGGKRQLLIFHCEFSSERAPKLCRFLRQKDREQNKEHYPALNYPEVYILNGGYKAFYEYNREMCEPMNYTPMLHADHSADMRHFRIKSKSWTAGEKRRYAMKTLRF